MKKKLALWNAQDRKFLKAFKIRLKRLHHSWRNFLKSETHRNEGFQQLKDFTMVEENFENHRSETHWNEGFQQWKDFIMVEENFENHRSETHRNEVFNK